MGVHKSEFMNPLDKIKCLMEEEIAVLDYEEADLLDRLAIVREKRSFKQLVYSKLLQYRSNEREIG